jgi:hypothetical protein
MHERIGSIFSLILLASVWCAADTAKAEGSPYSLTVEPAPEPSALADVELSAELGVMDRGTTGVGAPLLGYGYDHGGGALGAIGTRFLFRFGYGDYFRHGLDLRAAYSAGEFFGVDGAGMHVGQLDVGYVFRTEFPCMRGETRRIHLSGALGVTGLYADAGTGRGARDDMWNARVVAADALDHYGVGGYLTVDLTAHYDAAFVGLRLDAREHFAVGHSSIARDVTIGASLRFGVDISP